MKIKVNTIKNYVKSIIFIIPSLYKCELLLQLFKNCGNYLKILAILLCFYYIFKKIAAISKLLPQLFN